MAQSRVEVARWMITLQLLQLIWVVVRVYWKKEKRQKNKLTVRMTDATGGIPSSDVLGSASVSHTEDQTLPVGTRASVHTILVHEATARVDLDKVWKILQLPSARTPWPCSPHFPS